MEKKWITSEQWQNIYQLFSADDQQELLLKFVVAGRWTELFEALEHGAVLSAKVLWYVFESGKTNLIYKMLKKARIRMENVYDFLLAVDGQKEAGEFVLKNRLTDLFSRLDNKLLVQNGEWRVLAERKEFMLLAINNQFDLLEEYGEWVVLASYKQFDRIIRAEKWLALTISREGMELLIQYGKWDVFYEGLRLVDENKFTKQEILETLWNNGQQSLLFEKQQDDFLLSEKRYFDPYKRNNLWATILSFGFADEVDWEAYLQNVPSFSRDKVFSEAQKNKAWSFLAKHHKHWMLFKSGHLGWWRKSF